MEKNKLRRYTHNPLKYYKLDPSVKDPIFATEGSACFDIHAHIPSETKISVIDPWGYDDKIIVDYRGRFLLDKGYRALIPTGLIFDIPIGCAVRLYARSGLAWKNGLSLANSVGIVDCDYVEPVFVIVQNPTNRYILIEDASRICQAELILLPKYNLLEVSEKPTQKTDRDGGFGSTGTK